MMYGIGRSIIVAVIWITFINVGQTATNPCTEEEHFESDTKTCIPCSRYCDSDSALKCPSDCLLYKVSVLDNGYRTALLQLNKSVNETNSNISVLKMELAKEKLKNKSLREDIAINRNTSTASLVFSILVLASISIAAFYFSYNNRKNLQNCLTINPISKHLSQSSTAIHRESETETLLTTQPQIAAPTQHEAALKQPGSTEPEHQLPFSHPETNLDSDRQIATSASTYQSGRTFGAEPESERKEN